MFNSGIRKPRDSGEWGDAGASHRRRVMEMNDQITEWKRQTYVLIFNIIADRWDCSISATPFCEVGAKLLWGQAAWVWTSIWTRARARPETVPNRLRRWIADVYKVLTELRRRGAAADAARPVRYHEALGNNRPSTLNPGTKVVDNFDEPYSYLYGRNVR